MGFELEEDVKASAGKSCNGRSGMALGFRSTSALTGGPGRGGNVFTDLLVFLRRLFWFNSY